MSLTVGEVCAGVSFRDSSGIVRTGTLDCSITLCAASGASGCKVTGPFRSVDKNAIEANKDKMTTAATIVNVQGTFNPSAYRDCTDSTETDCTTTSALPAISQGDIHPGVIKAGTPLGSQLTGAYPSAAHPLPQYDAGKQQLTATNMTAALGSTVGYQFWDHKGQKKTLTGHSNFKASNIITSNTIYGLGGSAPVATAIDCAAEGDTDCYVNSNSNLVAFNTAHANPAIIRTGVTILGTTGKYPSSQYPLDGSDGTVDLDLANFGQLSTDGTYEYFDGNGDRYTVSGDTDFVPSNIKKDVTILGQKGDFQGVDLSSIDPYDLRAGVAGTGMLDPNAACTSKDDCVGAGKLWQDVSVENGESQGCQSGSGICYFHSAMLKQDWVFLLVKPQDTWENVATLCENISINDGSKSDWRMPTQKEALIASTHGLSKLGIYGLYLNNSSERSFWTSTANSYDGHATSFGRIAYYQVDDHFESNVVTDTKDVVCVHDAP